MKKFLWRWKLFWGNCYTIYEKDTIVKKILIYHKKIYVLKK